MSFTVYVLTIVVYPAYCLNVLMYTGSVFLLPLSLNFHTAPLHFVVILRNIICNF